MATNILQLLQKRQEGQFSFKTQRQLAGSLHTTYISLAQIVDREHKLLHGHVVLGFTLSGHHLLSYVCQIDENSEYSYSLHWWQFDMWKPLVKVFNMELFCGMVIKRDLHLVVCQNEDQTHITVVARSSVCDGDDRRQCYVSIFPDPAHDHTPHSIFHGHTHNTSLTGAFSLHFKFDLLSPYPTFIPSVYLKIPGCILINTCDSLVALRYSVESEGAWLAPCDGCGLEFDPYSHCSYTRQVFVKPDGMEAGGVEDYPVHTPVRLLPIDVYYHHHPLVLTNSSHFRPCPSHSTPDPTPSGSDSSHFLSGEVKRQCMVLEQSSLDIEFWLNETLQKELKLKGLDFRCLSDYDMQLAEVCRSSHSVVCVIAVLGEARPSPKFDFFGLNITASWNISSGETKLLRMSDPKTLPLSIQTRNLNPSSRTLTAKLSNLYRVPTLASQTVRSFSNHTVFSGKSLDTLFHPNLPVTLVLRKKS